jgi:hypothetical protein
MMMTTSLPFCLSQTRHPSPSLVHRLPPNRIRAQLFEEPSRHEDQAYIVELPLSALCHPPSSSRPPQSSNSGRQETWLPRLLRSRLPPVAPIHRADRPARQARAHPRFLGSNSSQQSRGWVRHSLRPIVLSWDPTSPLRPDGAQARTVPRPAWARPSPISTTPA